MIKLRNDSIKTMMMVILFPVIFFSCIEEEMTCERVPMAVHYVGAGGSVVTRGTEISSADDLKGTKFGLFASLTPASLVTETYFNASATVNDNLTATISPGQFWPTVQSSMKFFSWYPFDGGNHPIANFDNPAEMVLTYSASTDAAAHKDVMAGVTQTSQWGAGINVHFYHTLTKVSFTFKKKDPAPEELIIEKIQFQGVGAEGKLTVPSIPTATTESGKPAFVWNNITTGTVTSDLASTPTAQKTVGTVATQIGDTFFMLPATTFSDAAKMIVITNHGIREFLLKDIAEAVGSKHSWQSGEHINYNMTMSNEEYTITATPLPWEWDENSVNVIFDGQYYLKLSQGKVRLGANGATVNITAETNYDADPNTGYPVGALLNKMGMATWATVTMGTPTLSGTVRTYDITVVIPSYTAVATEKRETQFYIDAGNLHHKVLLEQWGGIGVWLTSSETLDTNDLGIGLTQRRVLTFTSGNPGNWTWEVTGVQDPDKILLNWDTMFGSKGGNGGVIYFYYNAGTKEDTTATLTVSNTNGDNPDITVTLAVPQW
ncbi:fimbrillin family protein [Bacteroides salyersiae]|uniref:fimbrillin family protein n=1 Tax=Bacteroides salyersiae TaxID=291644 RepID=UPI003DA5052B